MTPATQALMVAVISAVFTSSAWPIFGPKIIEWINRKKIAEEKKQQAAEDAKKKQAAAEEKKQQAAAERLEHDRDEWMKDSKDAYVRVAGECAACKDELASCKKELADIRRNEIEPMKRDNAAIKEALLGRIEVLDEILPYTNLPDEKIDELRRVNRAQRAAVFRDKW
jgi:hypothetical protein